MNLNSLIDCLNQIRGILDERGLSSGSLMHSTLQLLQDFQAQLRGELTRLEEKMTIEVKSQSGEVSRLELQMDNVSRSLTTIKGGEIKTSPEFRQALDYEQLTKYIIKSMGGLPQTHQLAGIEFDDKTKEAIARQLDRVVERMVKEGFSESAVQQGLRNINFVDKAGEAIRAEFNSRGKVIFDEVAKEIAGKGGQLQFAFEKEVHGSPDFGPAMAVLFGPSGKLAGAAQHAATGTNLDPALQNLEKKIEHGVSQAMDEAGNAVSAHGAHALAGKIGAGATALGNILSAAPAIHQSITALGEAWDKPLQSTADYMNLFGAAGSLIGQGVQTFEALASATKIASAAQAVFNAVMAMNPIVLIILAVIALIAAIVLLIVYWDEVKLAVLKAANFISIQLQRVGHFFVGVGHLAGQVWDWIVAKLANAGIAIINFFIKIGTDIQNFFIGVINGILGMYNKLATSVIGDVLGLKEAELIPEVNVETRLIPPKEVPKIDVEAAFKTDGEITGGLEGAIAEQQGVIARKEAEEAQKKAAQPPGALPGLPPGGPIPSAAAPVEGPAGLSRPSLPGPGVPPPGGGGPVDQSVHVEGGITVNINAERLEADSARLLTDEIILGIQERLYKLCSVQNFRTGTRTSALT